MSREQRRKLVKNNRKIAVAYKRRKFEKRSTKSEAYVSARALKLEQIEQYRASINEANNVAEINSDIDSE